MFSKIPKTSFSNFTLRNLFQTKEDVPQKDVPKNLKPWQKFDWPKEKEQGMYIEWGVHCLKKKPEKAEHYFERAIELCETDANSLYHLSKCQRQMAKTQMAFENAKKAVAFESRKQKIAEEYCRCLYDLNEFEIAKAKSTQISSKYVFSKGKSFTRLTQVIDGNINDCCGPACGDFFLKRQHILPELQSYHQKKNLANDKRPLWKILKEQNKCDILSVLEKETEKLHPREAARRKLASKVYHQHYLPCGWRDALYQKDLEKDKKFLSFLSESTPPLQTLLKTQNEAVRKFVKMLHARSPLYNEYKYKFENKNLSNLMHEQHLNFVQYQTRRALFNILSTIKSLRKKGAIEKLADFVEKTMGDWTILKTRRVAPWKQEFLYEVYNTLALAFADKYVVEPHAVNLNDTHALEKLFNIKPIQDTVTPIKCVFGKKAPQIDFSAWNQAHEKKRNFLERMEKRLQFAKEPIEKAYIYHEMARAHFKTGNFSECEFVANKGVRVKSNICLARREKCTDALENAANIAIRLKSWQIYEFIDLAKSLNQSKMSRFRNLEKSDSMSRRSKSRSYGSMLSVRTRKESIRSGSFEKSNLPNEEA